jgi:hypothetical protein
MLKMTRRLRKLLLKKAQFETTCSVGRLRSDGFSISAPLNLNYFSAGLLSILGDWRIEGINPSAQSV